MIRNDQPGVQVLLLSLPWVWDCKTIVHNDNLKSDLAQGLSLQSQLSFLNKLIDQHCGKIIPKDLLGNKGAQKAIVRNIILAAWNNSMLMFLFRTTYFYVDTFASRQALH